MRIRPEPLFRRQGHRRPGLYTHHPVLLRRVHVPILPRKNGGNARTSQKHIQDILLQSKHDCDPIESSLVSEEMLTTFFSFLLSQQLVPLSVVAAECVAAFAVDAILQMHFLQAGALWHLLIAMFQYDYTLEESGVAANENTSLQVRGRGCARRESIFRLSGF